MDKLVYTKNGIMNLSDLELEVKAEVQGQALVISCEWFDKGVMVRRDAWANLLHPGAEVNIEQGEVVNG
jgi:hypothetical protein